MSIHLIKTIKLPIWSASYLFNADSTGLDPEDAEMVHDWEQNFDEQLPITLNVINTELGFEPFPEFGLACDCYEVEIYSSKETE